MRTITLIATLLLTSGLVNSQSLTSKNRKAVKLYTEARDLMGARSFDKAYDKLHLAIEKDPDFAEAYLKLANIYRIRMNDSLQMWCYRQVVDRYPQVPRFSGAWFQLGYNAFKSGNYNLALNYLEGYNRLTSGKGKYVKRSQLMIENSHFAIDYKTNEFQFNPRPLPLIINQFRQQYFPVLTADQKTLIYVRRDGDEELMLSQRDDNDKWGPPQSISNNINSEFNEGTCSISADGRMLVFTSCMGRKGYGSCDLYVSYKTGNEWSIPENLGSNINSTAWDSQPSLSADGRTLYFVSNRSGGFGKRDIYVSLLNDNGMWAKPRNIGPDINTARDDISPFIHPNGQRLYFSTEGRLGFGGFDIYFAEKEGVNKWSAPVNFGYPINTHNDEVSMYISSDGRKGYYSYEVQTKEKVSSTLYEIDIPPTLQVTNRSSYVYGEVTDNVTDVPLKATVSLIDLNTNETIELVHSDSITGQYLIVLTEGAEYGLFAESEGYLYRSENFNLNKQLINPVEIDLKLDPIKAGSKVVLKNIFFEFDSYKLTDHSRTELNKIALFLVTNENIAIEISGYTDNIGNEKYNLKLSEKRAKAVYNYLVDIGMDNTKLSYKGLGASNFLNDNLTEEDRLENRRIEFKVLK